MKETILILLVIGISIGCATHSSRDTGARQSVIIVLGAVHHKGPMPFSRGMSLAQAFAEAGGVTWTGGVTVVRKGKSVFKLEPGQETDDRAHDFRLEPGDVVVIRDLKAVE